jgi:hypothetical protein
MRWNGSSKTKGQLCSSASFVRSRKRNIQLQCWSAGTTARVQRVYCRTLYIQLSAWHASLDLHTGQQTLFPCQHYATWLFHSAANATPTRVESFQDVAVRWRLQHCAVLLCPQVISYRLGVKYCSGYYILIDRFFVLYLKSCNYLKMISYVLHDFSNPLQTHFFQQCFQESMCSINLSSSDPIVRPSLSYHYPSLQLNSLVIGI